jgi:predicted nucleic acid-binding Zn ribbon protein
VNNPGLQRGSEVVGECVIKMVRGDRQKVCEVCGEEFLATRRDTKTCSDGCKQKAYRQRKKEVQQNQ